MLEVYSVRNSIKYDYENNTYSWAFRIRNIIIEYSLSLLVAGCHVILTLYIIIYKDYI